MEQDAPYIMMYQIWVRMGQEETFRTAWNNQIILLQELGVIDGWVVTRGGGRCDSYLVWQKEALWLQTQRFWNMIDTFRETTGDLILGWFSPVRIKATEVFTHNDQLQPSSA